MMRVFKWMSLTLAVLGGLVGGLVWLLATAPGTRVLASVINTALADRVTLTGVTGAAARSLRVGELRLRLEGTRITVHDLSLDLAPGRPRRGEVVVERLAAKEVEIAWAAATTPAGLPRDLQLPVALEVRALEVGQVVLRAPGLPAPQVASALRARFMTDGRRHTLAALSLQSHWGAVTAQGVLDGVAPFALQASARAGLPGQAMDVSAAASGRLDAIDLTLVARGQDLFGHVSVAASPFSKLPLSRLTVQLDRLDPARVLAGAPSAQLAVTADWAMKAAGTTWEIAGPVSLMNAAPRSLDAHGMPLSLLRGVARIRPHEAVLEQLEASVADGVVTGVAGWSDQGAHGEFQLRAVDPARLHSVLKPARVSGQVSVSADQNRWQARGQLNDTRWQARFAAGLAAGQLALDTLSVTTAGGQAEASGTLALAGPQAFAFKARLQQFNPAQFIQSPAARINAQLDGSGQLQPMVGRVQFALDDSTLDTPAGRRALVGQGVATWSAGHVADLAVSLDLAGNRLKAAGAFGRPGDVLKLEADFPALETFGVGLAGRWVGRAQMAGSPAALAVSVDVEASGARVATTRVDALKLTGALASGAQGALQVSGTLAGLSLDGRQVVRSGSLSVSGTRRDHLATLSLGLGWGVGGGGLTAQARGGLGDAWAWAGALDQLHYTGERLPLTLAAPARLEVGGQRLVLGPAKLRGRQAEFSLQDTRWTPAAGVIARGALTGLRVRAPQWVAGGLQVGATWDVAFGETRTGRLAVFREAGDIALGGEDPVSLGLTDARVEASLAGDLIKLDTTAAGERLGALSGNLSTALEHGGWQLGRGAALSGTVLVQVPALDWLGPLIDPNIKTAGAMKGAFQFGGRVDAPTFTGELAGDGLAVALIDQGLRVQQGVLRMRLDQSRARLEQLTFAVPFRAGPAARRAALAGVPTTPGRVSARGEIDLANIKGQFDLQAERALVLARDDRWVMVSGTGRVGLDRAGARVNGQTRVDAAAVTFAPSRVSGVSDDVVVLGRQAPAGRSFRLDLDVQADLGERFYFAAQGLDARLVGQLHVRAIGQAPMQASGSIAMVDGVYDAYGQTLNIQRGLVNFQGPLDNPGLNVRAVRLGLPVEAGVEVSGTASAPRVRLVSDPPVSDAEKLSWMVLGRGLDQAGRSGADSAVLLSAAGAIFGGGGGKGVANQLGQALGLDQISIASGDQEGARSQTTVAGTLGPAREAGLSSSVVQVGKRISSAAYLSFEHSLAGLEQAVKLTYQLTRRISVVARAGTDNTVDVFYTFSFD